jgi:HPt (histidine-containing phosphotransfer) domain-containing protein
MFSRNANGTTAALRLAMAHEFDAAPLLAEYVDEALVRELVGLFVDNTGDQLASVINGIARRDPGMVKSAAHRLRGSISTFGAPTAVRLAQELETMGTTGNLEGADALANHFVVAVQQLCDDAAAWLAAGGQPGRGQASQAGEHVPPAGSEYR